MNKPEKTPPVQTTRLPRRLNPWYFKGYKFQPDVMFDVGVFEGTAWLYKALPDPKYVLVDPQPGCKDMLKIAPRDYDFHAVALGEEAGQVTLNVPETKPGRGGAMASILTRSDRAANRFSSVETVDVPVERLDTIAADYDGRVGIKIDTEGYEGQVLGGAPETLKRADFAVLEMSVAKRFDNVLPPSVLVARLAEAGLEFCDVLAAATYPGKRPRPHSMDALFVRWDAI
ncbi:MAG: FkbM family methyltransferase [Paracoccaceae bacterium]